MRILFLCFSIFLVSAVYIFWSMPRMAVGGFTRTELAFVGIAFLCNTISAIVALLSLRAQNRKARREIARIKEEIVRNEAKQRAIFFEMTAIRRQPIRPEIKKKLPQSRSGQ